MLIISVLGNHERKSAVLCMQKCLTRSELGGSLAAQERQEQDRGCHLDQKES
jgi:hypothetical protein